VTANIGEADFFAIQLNNSTDITGEEQLLPFSKFVCNGDIIEQFLLCKPRPETKNAKTFLMLPMVVSVLMICHGNHTTSAWMVLPLYRET
jgi:hypothetical protein